jgi:hypothetical protein
VTSVNEFLAVTQQNGANALINMANVARIVERDHGLEGAQVVYTDGTTLQVRDDFNALAVRMAFLPVPPRPREQMWLFTNDRDECPSCTGGRGSGGLCGVCAGQRIEAERMAVAR